MKWTGRALRRRISRFFELAASLLGIGGPAVLLGVAVVALWTGGGFQQQGACTLGALAVAVATAAGAATVALGAAVAGTAWRVLARRASALAVAGLALSALLSAAPPPWAGGAVGVGAWFALVAGSLLAAAGLFATRPGASETLPWRPVLIVSALVCLIPALLAHAGLAVQLDLGLVKLHPLWRSPHLALCPLVAGPLAVVAGLARVRGAGFGPRLGLALLSALLVLRSWPLVAAPELSSLTVPRAAWWLVGLLLLVVPLVAMLVSAVRRRLTGGWVWWLVLPGALLATVDPWIMGQGVLVQPTGSELAGIGLMLLVVAGSGRLAVRRLGLADELPGSRCGDPPRAWLGAGVAIGACLGLALLSGTFTAHVARASLELPPPAAETPLPASLSDILPVESPHGILPGGMMTSEVLHTRHYAKAGVGGADVYCVACHHKSVGTDVTQGCTACHGAERRGELLSVREAQHRTCFRCHLEVNNRPTNFRGATDQPTDLPIACLDCHENQAKPVQTWRGLGEQFPMVPDRLSCINW